MSFGGFGSGSGAFGSNNNQQSSSAFGGFGQTSTAGGFGSTPAFGSTANSTGGSLFGNTNTNTGSAFGGFGASNNATASPFGQNKPAFGATSTSGGLFGSGAATTTSNSAFGGFGNAGTTTSGFGSTGTAFGSTAAKPAFGASTGGGLFGQSASTGTGFGQTAPATSAFATTSPFQNNTQNNGTQSTPFSAFTEKEGTTTNQYQVITAMPAYNKYQTEELRLVDYMQGRKYGNGSGQAGAFGASTGFGGFGGNTQQPAQTSAFGATSGTNTGGLFGSTNNTSTPFGSTQPTTNAFGASNTGGSGLFGAKPAGTSLFGSTPAAPAATGGLFGNTGSGFGTSTTSGGFGASTTTPAFGQSQAKPLFGATANTGGFGSTTGTTSSLFGGATNTTGAFGQTQQQAAPTGGFAFGQQNQQQPQQTQTGGLFGGFGNTNNNQAKPSGLFGSTNTTTTTGGLFGQQQPAQQQTGGLFGNSTNQQQSGGLFGNKPATSSLFGTSTNTGGLFGNNNNQQQSQQNTGGLFGSTNQNNTGAFGARPGLSTGGLGGGLFGQSNTQAQPTGGLFGGNQSQQQQPQQGGLLGSSLFASTQQQPMQQNQPNVLTASLNDNPYGNYQLFASLNTPQQSPGPLATPLGASSTARKQAVIPHYRVVPHASSRLLTPQKGPQGFGFSYSNYNSPMSPANGISPLSGSLLGGSSLLGRSLGKSLSTSNLRHSYSAQESSILAPGAFSSNRGGPGSMKKLNINRNLQGRRSLFANDAPAAGLNKRVSFERNLGEHESSPQISGALVVAEQRDRSPAASTASPAQNGSSTGKELAIVPEDSAPQETPPSSELGRQNGQARKEQKDQQLGEYSMQPNIQQLTAMNRQQRSSIENFTVQREGAGKIVFSKVDLNNIPLEEICGQIVDLSTRQATVYGDKSSLRTPPQGQGLNVRSTITLENSWPRQKGGRMKVAGKTEMEIQKHIRILKGAKDTKFISYDSGSGQWTFEVEHYTTYGLTYDDDDSVMTTTISHDSPSATEGEVDKKTQASDTTPELAQDDSFTDSQESGVDDTFDFKKGKRKHLPGEFDDSDLNDVDLTIQDQDSAPYDEFANVDGNDLMDFDPFLEAAAMDYEEPLQRDQMEFDIPEHVSGHVKDVDDTAKHAAETKPPTPQQPDHLFVGGNWMEHLQHTMSPIKRDRQALRGVSRKPASGDNAKVTEVEDSETAPFGSTVDIMKSLFGQLAGHGKSSASKVSSSVTSQSESLRMPSSDKQRNHRATAGDKYSRFSKGSLTPKTIEVQREGSQIIVSGSKATEAPRAKPSSSLKLQTFPASVNTATTAGQHEQSAWELATILFGDLSDSIVTVTGPESADALERQVRKEKLSEFWQRLVQQEVETAAQFGKSAEEKALIYLTGGSIPDACTALLSGTNFHLAQLTAQLPGDQTFRDTVNAQIEIWRKRTDWPEMTDAVRALYEIFSGQVCECRGLSVTGQENKASTFKFSTRYRYDWRRAFGLRLWFGTLRDDDIAQAVVDYSADLTDFRESAMPSPWFLLRLEDQGWTDPEPNSREDVLWGLLKLYTSQAESKATDSPISVNLETMFAPESISGYPYDARLSFQLLSILSASKSVSLNEEAASKVLDKLALTYADALDSQITSQPELMVTAAWVLLHLSDQNMRNDRIRSLLNKHANLLNPEETICKNLTASDGLQIPYIWVCASLAKHAEDVEKDTIAQARWLIEGEELAKAHDVFCRQIGPEAIISLDYGPMREIVNALREADVSRKVDWETGAGLYSDFLELVDLQETSQASEYRAKVKKLVKKLANSLEALTSAVQGDETSQEEKIAIRLMAEEVLDTGRREKVLENESLLRLPLTESGYLKQSMAMSVSFYQSLMLKA